MEITNPQVQQVLEQLGKLPMAAKGAIYVALASAIVAVYWFTMGTSEMGMLNTLNLQLTTVQNEISEARAVASNLKTFREQRELLGKQLNDALSKLPDSKQLPGLLTDISGLGKKSGLEIRSFDPQTEQRRGFYAEVPIKVEFYGRYHDVGSFFDRLSRLSRIVNITEMDMKVESKRSGNNPRLKVTGVATTFRFLEKAGSSASGE
jgi:type IV pilus assembly protein PilO